MQKYKKNFLKSRRLTYAPDDLLCENCWSRLADDCHHVVFRSLGGSDEGDNLIALCRPCHDLAHMSRLGADELKKRVELILSTIEEMHRNDS